MSDEVILYGEGGGSKKARTPVETPNSLVTKTTAKVLFLYSEGEIGGLADQANKRKSVFFDNVPAQNDDGSVNFPSVTVDERYGLPSQTAIPGFTSVSSTFNVGTQVTVAAPVTYTSSTSAADAIRVTIRFSALFKQEDNGDINKTTVQFQIYRRLGAGSWNLYDTITVNDKTNSPADRDYLVQRPSGSGTWGVQVRRVTADNSLSTLANDIYFQIATELQYVNIPYNGYAYAGVVITADDTDSNYPLVAFDVKGIKVKVPNNYTVSTRTYSGNWSGTFSSTRQVCDNPAWVLYDILTNSDYGMGIPEENIDKFSFYDAAVYNDQPVPALVDGSVSGTEPRFTFNHQFITDRKNAWEFIQELASTFNSAVYTAGNLVKLVQDRPTNFTRIIANSSVVDGRFEYASSALSTRNTACTVYWQNPNENWLAVPAYYEDAAGVARYGLQVTEIEGIGITSEGQAMRKAKWHVETSISNLATTTFKVGFKNADIMPGEVVKIMDSDFAEVTGEAILVSSTSNTITLDRPISVSSGHSFDIVGSDGVTIYTRTISANSTGSTVTFSGAALSVSTGAQVIFTTAVAPRLFKVTSVRQESAGEWLISAVQYDPNKFARVDNTPAGITPIFQNPALIPSAPQSLTFKEYAINDNNSIRRGLLISWSRPAQGTAQTYIVKHRLNTGAWTQVETAASSLDINPASDGLYEVEVYARSPKGVMSSPATGSYEITIAGSGLSPLDPPTDLVETNFGGLVFKEDNLSFKFTNPSSNANKSVALRDFEVRILNAANDAVLRTYYVAPVVAGAIQTSSYSYEDNKLDGGPRRTIKVQVRCRDTNNKLSNPVTSTFINPAPGIPIGITVAEGLGQVKIVWGQPLDPDFEGVLIWRGTSASFMPSINNLVYDGSDGAFVDASLEQNTTYFYKIAAYDSFEKPYDGAGLNISAPYNATPKFLEVNINKVINSNFEARADVDNPERPYGWIAYEFSDPVRHAWISVPGRNSAKAAALKAITGVPNPFGIMSTPTENGGVEGGWQPNTTYMLSWYAKKANGAGFTTMEPVWNTAPAYNGGASTAVAAPTLTTSWQRYVYKISWANTVESDGRIFLRVNGTYAVNDEIHIDHIQVEKASEVTDYTPRVEELILPGSITETAIQPGSITTPLLAANSVVAGKVAANTIGANEIITNSITGDKLVANSITADKLVITGAGQALNADPYTRDITAWNDYNNFPDNYNISVVADSTSPSGYALQNSVQGSIAITGDYIPLNGGNYILRLSGKAQSGTATFYAGIAFFNSSKTLITGNSSPSSWDSYGTFHYMLGSGTNLPGSWATYEVSFGPNETYKIPSGAVYARPVIIFAENATATHRFTSIRLEEKAGGSLIVRGGISADRLNVTELSAVSATIGTLRTATSGQRVEIQDNKIVVYDSSNAVRVKIGNLS